MSPSSARLAMLLSIVLAGTLVVAGFPAATAVAQTECGRKPAPKQCKEWICVGGTWDLVVSAAGTSCNDGNACTYGDVCNGAGSCTGTPVTCTPSKPCESSTCNGTATCTVGVAPPGPCPVASDNPCEAVCDGQSYYCQPL